jgi:hypothetical protein
MLLLDLTQLAHEPIILRVRPSRCVEHEVFVIGALYLLAQPLGASRAIVVNVRQTVIGGLCLMVGDDSWESNETGARGMVPLSHSLARIIRC